MALVIVVVGVILAAAILSALPRVDHKSLRGALVVAAVAVFLICFSLASFRFVGEARLGVVTKTALGPSLPPGKIIATAGEKGPQARILPPGWHAWLWPIIYDVELVPVLEVPAGSVAILSASDGQPLPSDAIYAPEWGQEEFKRMAEDAEYFLGEGGGYKGPQSSVLKPGAYRINPKLFKHEIVPAVNVAKATVGVVKSNVGPVAIGDIETDTLVDRGNRGIWRQPLLPQQYYLNTQSYEITDISTAKRVVRYAKAAGKNEEREITVRSSDGFTFPVDVRIEFEIEPTDAPRVVARFGDDGSALQERLNSAVRAIFRNNAESVKAIDYVKQRSEQESQSLKMLTAEMSQVGVTITAVRIGDVGDEKSLGTLLKTQTDREIALQEQITFQEQQRAAEQNKELTRTEQEAEEEKRLATATYEVMIAEQSKEKRVIEAGAEAEAIRIQAQAQADAYQLIAEQIGKGNAALVEILKIVGEKNVNITPRVMVIGGAGGNGAGGSMSNPEATALIGTMLDSMVSGDVSGD